MVVKRIGWTETDTKQWHRVFIRDKWDESLYRNIQDFLDDEGKGEYSSFSSLAVCGGHYFVFSDEATAIMTKLKFG